MTHQPCDCQLFHDPADDCSDAYTDLTSAELVVVDLLNLHPGHGRTVRLTPAERQRVAAVADWALTVRPPLPRQPADGQLARRRTDQGAA